MVPMDSKHDRRWSSENATLVLLDIRRKAERDLLVLDEQRSGGRLNAENGYSTYVDVTNDPKAQNRKYRPDPVLASFKHSGVDTDTLTAKRWGEFCSKPQDEEATIARFGLNKAENAIAGMVERGAELEAAVSEAKKAPQVAPVKVPVPEELAPPLCVEPPTMPEPPQRRSPRTARVARS